jgi:hypothetical protein
MAWATDRALALKTFAEARERAAEHISAQASQLWRFGIGAKLWNSTSPFVSCAFGQFRSARRQRLPPRCRCSHGRSTNFTPKEC